MAGSWGHVTVTDDDDVLPEQVGTLLSPEQINNMLENGGDVAEAVEQMFGMIWWLADELARAVTLEPQTFQAERRRQALQLIGQAEARYPDGLALGGQR